MTIKSKNRIYKESKIVLIKIETYTNKKMQYLWSNDIRKYQLLVFYFEKKNFIWEKSSFYA